MDAPVTADDLAAMLAEYLKAHGHAPDHCVLILFNADTGKASCFATPEGHGPCFGAMLDSVRERIVPPVQTEKVTPADLN